MAAKLILSMNGVVLQEYALNKERMTIGRKEHNDIVIDNLAVSGEHAAIVTLLNDSFLEDLDSTNGVVVNGSATKKHFLQNNDLIEIGKYKLKYLNDHQGHATAEDFEKTMILRAPLHTPASRQDKDSSVEATGKYRTVTSPQPSFDQKLTEVQQLKAVSPSQPASPLGQAPVPQQAKAAEVQQPSPVAMGASVSQQPGAVIQILSGPNAGKELELVKNLTTFGKPGVQVAVLTRRPHGYFITYVEGATYPTVNGKLLDDQPHQLADHDIIELAGIKMEFYFKS